MDKKILIALCIYLLINSYNEENSYVMENIKEIHIMFTDGHTSSVVEYLYDFENKEVLLIYTHEKEEYKRNTLCYLEEEKINYFFEEAKGMLEWKNSYESKDVVMDSGYWHVEIVFNDGIIKSTRGENNGDKNTYPKDYKKIINALNNLTKGEFILE